ncbi:hypothetical protein Tco_0566358 [Tanacetum coccineum]
MDDPDITIEEYIQLENERALRNGKEYNWETATYVIVYNDAWASKSSFSSEPTISPQHVNEVDLKDETSFSKYDDEEYNDDDDDKIAHGSQYGEPSGQLNKLVGMLIFWNYMCDVVMLEF